MSEGEKEKLYVTRSSPSKNWSPFTSVPNPLRSLSTIEACQALITRCPNAAHLLSIAHQPQIVNFDVKWNLTFARCPPPCYYPYIGRFWLVYQIVGATTSSDRSTTQGSSLPMSKLPMIE
ncbi:hypothetical protein NL676_038188 [Syzygium grande]|nr:hypothetical protein NL676_038188 [Syzygium grande]